MIGGDKCSVGVGRSVGDRCRALGAHRTWIDVGYRCCSVDLDKFLKKKLLIHS